MRIALALLMTLAASPALAHVGHLGDVAGHDHWLGAAAIGAAIAIGLWQAAKGRKTAAAKAETEDEAADEEPQEA
ncbi:DUF6732 family protein [Pseudooceanicola sp. C21-150M6]|uniref:DUF6732 family protein n=1 Tax=Pseudooceanicola sp. C21-150M6 TaxID=3434355 RepID=UPI003D7FDAEE